MVAMHDYYYYISTRASPLQHKDQISAEGVAHNFGVNMEEISRPGHKTL